MIVADSVTHSREDGVKGSRGSLKRMVQRPVCCSGLCLYAVSPFSDRIYGMVTVRYGPEPYNTVKTKIRYGSGTVRETGQPYKLAWPPVLRRLVSRYASWQSSSPRCLGSVLLSVFAHKVDFLSFA